MMSTPAVRGLLDTKFTLDVDHRAGDAFRVVQLTPPGSACSITIGTGITQVAPGTYQACTSS